VTETALSDSTGGPGCESQRYRPHGVERALDTLELLAAADQITMALGGPPFAARQLGARPG
jgi:hypothetical protein